jgi:hypothetical protein
MFVAVTCPQCRHRGYVPHHVLPCALYCSRCDGRHNFQRGDSPQGDRSLLLQKQQRPKIFEDLPDDLWQWLSGEEGPTS